tara:strand:- start:1041 stop:1361 length:321 start_codon:yes stop_codon:yes gene_type:complete
MTKHYNNSQIETTQSKGMVTMDRAHKQGLMPKDPTLKVIDTFESDFETRASKLNEKIMEAWTGFLNTNGFNSQQAFRLFNQCIMKHEISRAVRAQKPTIIRESDLE